MKRIQILFLGLLAMLCAACGVACEEESPPMITPITCPIDSGSAPNDECPDGGNVLNYQKKSFTVTYDYGICAEGEATMLLEGSISLFFDPAEYKITEPLLAGDQLTVSYTGDMRAQETYPSTVLLQGEIIGINHSPAACIEVVYRGGKIEDVKGGYGFINLPQYVLLQDGGFVAVDEMEEGTKLYCSFAIPKSPVDMGNGVWADINIDCKKMTASALYAYNPYFPISANEVTPQLCALQAGEIMRIDRKSYNGSVGPHQVVDIQRTENQEEIAKVLSRLQTLFYRKGTEREWEIDGGGTVEYIFYTDGDSIKYSVYAYDSFYCHEGEYYAPECSPPTFIVDEQLFEFMGYEECSLYVNAQWVADYPQTLKGYLFKKSDIPLVYPPQKIVLQADGWRLILLDEKHFLIEETGDIYEVVGQLDFSQFFTAAQ